MSWVTPGGATAEPGGMNETCSLSPGGAISWFQKSVCKGLIIVAIPVISCQGDNIVRFDYMWLNIYRLSV